MVAVGTVDGWLEIWKLEVFKYEKEYAKDFLDEMNEEENDVVNDADSPDKIYADAKLVFRRKFYDNTVSLLSCSENQPLLTVASYFDKDIYVINASPSSSFTEVKSLTLGSDKNRPVSVFWKGEVVWVGCGNGLLFTFFPEIVTQVDDGDHAKDETKSEDVPSVAKAETSAIYPKAIWESRLKSMSATVPMFGAGGGIVVVRHDAAVLTVIDELPSVADMRENGLIDHENSTGEDVPLVDLPSDMTDSTTIFDISNLCVANAGCTQLIASGASDGSIFIWRAKRGDISLINKYHIHCRPVLSLCFTEDASKVISTSADGSMFVVSVDRTINRPPHTTAQLLENDLANMVNAGSICSDSVLWKEHQMELKTAELKESNKAKSMHFQSIVDNISGRLQTLLKRNEEAGELEKMDLHEFVVDVKQQKAIEEANSKKVAKLREEYENKNARNELIAARLREACWDTMETHSVSLSTIHEEDNLKFVSSFPVEKVSPGESVEIERIKRLRSIEILTQRSSSGKDNGGKSDRTPTGNWRFSWGGNLHSSPVMISWLMNDGARWARENVVEMIQEADKAAASAAEAKDKGSDSKQDDKKKKKDGKQDSPETASTDHDEGSAGELGGDGDQDVDLKNIFNLLYAPQTVRTPVQKRSQIILLKEVLRRVKGNFNKHFQALYHEKEDVVSSITAKTTRINEIIDELELAEESSPPTPQWSNIEEPDSAVKIEDSEISSRPYESEAMREERLRLEEERRRAAASEDDDARQRALLDMMNGTLEVKRDVFAEASALHRPEWMDELDPALMTEAQKKEVEEFDAKYAALQEEKAAYRKSLELEMKRLRLEIAEAKKSFDEKVHAIDRIKIFVNREILAQELYISRLALSMVKREQSWGLLKATEREIEENRKLRTELSRKIDRVSAAVENAKNSLQAVQDEEKNMDRSFKRDLQTQSNTTFDQDTLKNFTNLFRIRTFHDDGRADDGSEVSSSVIGGRNSRGMLRRRGSLKRSYGTSTNDHSTRSKLRSSRGTSNKEGMGQLQKAANELKNPEPPKVSIVNENDPFYPLFMAREKEQRAVESHIPQMIPLNIDIDCPEGFAVDPYIWSVLQELRMARIAKEIEGKRQHTAYTELKRKLDDLAAQEDAIIAQSDALKARREDILQHLQDLSEDLDVVVTLRQGQDEVECGAVVTDYSDARLLPSSIIRKYNLRINELGKEKIGVLSKIKQFRRKMNLVDWEVKHLRLEAWHLEEYYTDSQLFRVTRDLQKVIKDGSDHDQSRARLEKIAVRKDFLKKNGDAKVEKLKKAIERLRTQMEERDYENSKFTGKIDALKSDVTVREQVVSHSKKNAEKGDRHSDRMRKVVARRKLVDTAQVQAEEIDYLKQELDKVRQKTFPSFVRATRNRLVYNPDERV